MALSFRTALAEIERALVRTLRLELVERETVADVAALQAFAVLGSSGTPALTDGQPIYVTAWNRCYQWDRASTADHDGAAVVRPTQIGATEAGRWLSTSSRTQTGYVRRVNYWQGERSIREFQERILAERPSVAIVWESAEHTARSTIPGAIYDYTARFSIWCVDENLRPDYEVLLGSGYAQDSAHPGVIAMLGDVKKALADTNKHVANVLGLAGGVKFIKLGSEDLEDADLAERVMVASLGIEVLASIENPDAPTESVQMDALYVQPRITHLNEAAAFDPLDYVVSGLRVSPGVGLTATPTAGEVVRDGERRTVTPTSTTFAANSETYLDMPRYGPPTYSAVARGLPAPALASGALRVARIVTDDLGIVGYEPIAPTSADLGDPNRVIPWSAS